VNKYSQLNGPAKKLPYAEYISLNRVKSILYYYMFFDFFRVAIKNRLLKIYKAFFFNKKSYFQRKFYSMPFIYEPRTYFVPYKRPKISVRHLSFQLIRLFYIMYSYKQLNKLIKKAKRSDAVFEHAFMLSMECKLPSFVYRSSFFSNMFESISFVKSGNL
jgi:hypothetical protein